MCANSARETSGKLQRNNEYLVWVILWENDELTATVTTAVIPSVRCEQERSSRY